MVIPFLEPYVAQGGQAVAAAAAVLQSAGRDAFRRALTVPSCSAERTFSYQQGHSDGLLLRTDYQDVFVKCNAGFQQNLTRCSEIMWLSKHHSLRNL